MHTCSHREGPLKWQVNTSRPQPWAKQPHAALEFSSEPGSLVPADRHLTLHPLCPAQRLPFPSSLSPSPLPSPTSLSIPNKSQSHSLRATPKVRRGKGWGKTVPKRICHGQDRSARR